jgi:AcrR family transcriptional regulator
VSVERQVLTAARSEIMEHGVASATLVRVAERAGVTVADLRQVFPGPRDLLTAVHEEVARELNGAALAAARAAPPDAFGPIVAGCRRLFELYVGDGVGRHVIHAIRQTLTLGEWHHLDRRFGVGALTGGLRPLADQGLIPADGVQELAVVIYGMVTESCTATADGLVDLSPDDVGTHVLAVLEAAARRGEPAG